MKDPLDGYTYSRDERLPVEVLVFEMAPPDVARFLDIDHEIWTLEQALDHEGKRIPFLSKEVWLNDSRPGEVTIVFVWESIEAWDGVGRPDLQDRLQAEFDHRFGRPITLVGAYHERAGKGIHRFSRFERT